MWYVYVLKSQKNGKIYVGMSQDIDRRLAEHNSGKSKFTSGHLPWKLVYSEACDTSIEARSREKYFKSAAGKKALAKIMATGSLPD
ncbi:MAG: GIY-YIG nuclease family protein [Cyclobacteriaceae bacterium]|nr:MAG: GIY-YIG nuclease family protein [Cyclobacteriaceae bacterium]